MKEEYEVSPLVKAMVESDFDLETRKSLAEWNKIIIDVWHIPDKQGRFDPERRAYVIMDNGIWRLLKCKAAVIVFAKQPNRFKIHSQRMKTVKECLKNLYKKD